MAIWEHLEAQISLATGMPFVIASKGVMGGGCINTGMRIDDGNRS